MMFFIRDCNGRIVGNPKGYKTMRGAQAQTSPRKPAGRAIWAAVDTREAAQAAARIPLNCRATSICSIQLQD